MTRWGTEQDEYYVKRQTVISTEMKIELIRGDGVGEELNYILPELHKFPAHNYIRESKEWRAAVVVVVYSLQFIRGN